MSTITWVLFNSGQKGYGNYPRRDKEKEAFFVDSRTSSKTVAYDVAKKLGLKTAERNVFLDDIEDEEEVIKQIELLISTAKRTAGLLP